MEASVKHSAIIALVLILFAVSLRLLPHPANFAPVGAVSLFGTAILPRRIGWWVPLAIMLVSDLFLGYYASLPFTWLGLVAVSLIGWQLRDGRWTRLPLGVLGGSVAFFAISNLGVWIASGMYAHTVQGLGRCFVAALPFFRATLASDICYSALLFGVYALALAASRSHASKPQPAL